jgi:putative oxidoreductase
MDRITNALLTVSRLAARIPYAFVALFLRIAIAQVFWASGRTKVEGVFTIKDSTYALFAEEYRVPLLPSDLAAVMASIAEHLFPLLLIIGLATRLSALGLIGMTLVIQFFVYPEAWWGVHSLWLGILLVIFTRGPGAISVDAQLLNRLHAAEKPHPAATATR